MMTDREQRIATYIGELRIIKRHIEEDRDLTEGDKGVFSPVEDAISDAAYTLAQITTDRLDDERMAARKPERPYMGGAS